MDSVVETNRWCSKEIKFEKLLSGHRTYQGEAFLITTKPLVLPVPVRFGGACGTNGFLMSPCPSLCILLERSMNLPYRAEAEDQPLPNPQCKFPCHLRTYVKLQKKRPYCRPLPHHWTSGLVIFHSDVYSSHTVRDVSKKALPSL